MSPESYIQGTNQAKYTSEVSEGEASWVAPPVTVLSNEATKLFTQLGSSTEEGGFALCEFQSRLTYLAFPMCVSTEESRLYVSKISKEHRSILGAFFEMECQPKTTLCCFFLFKLFTQTFSSLRAKSI